MNRNDAELSSFNTKDDYNDVPIRGIETAKKSAENKPERIKSMDYARWDKLDVDAEILKSEIEEEKIKKQYLKRQQEKEKLNTVVVKPEYMTETELTHSAEQERTRGNEFYRSGDYEEALSYYSNSLSFRPSIAVYNNRAITCKSSTSPIFSLLPIVYRYQTERIRTSRRRLQRSVKN